MASCPKCGSGNYRVQEPGAITSGYWCMNCKHSFDRLSTTVKLGMLGAVISIGGAFLSGLVGSDKDSDNNF